MKTFLTYLLLSIILTSCVKFPSPIPKPSENPNHKTTLSEAIVRDSFSWSTSKSVEVTIVGLPTIITIKNTLSISLEDGTRLCSLFHNMSKDLKLTIIIPVETTILTLKYGTMEYDLKVIDNKAEFSFIPDIPEEIEVP